MIKKYLKNMLCPDRVNRLQLDIDPTDTTAVRRAISLLYTLIPDEERLFPAGSLGSLRRKQAIDEPSLEIFYKGAFIQITRKANAKIFQVLDYLYEHPDEIDDLSVRKLEDLTGVSKSHCGTVLTNWKDYDVDKKFAAYKAEHEPEL